MLNNIRFSSFIFVAVSFLSTPFSFAQQTADEVLDQARVAYTQKNWTKLNSLLPQLQNHPLGMYPQYWALSQSVSAGSSDLSSPSVTDFLMRNKGNYLEERLTGDLMLLASRRDDVSSLLTLQEGAPKLPAYECATIQGQILNGQALLNKALSTFEPGDACINMISALVKTRQITFNQAWPLIGSLVENKKTYPQLKRLFGLWLSPTQAQTLTQVLTEPNKYLSKVTQLPEAEQERALFLIASVLKGRDGDLEKNYAAFIKQWGDQLNQQDRGWVQSQFALAAAFRLNPVAHRWYVNAGNVPLSLENQEWRIRSALRQSKIDWEWIRNNIMRMPDDLRTNPTWVYWLGRADKALGDKLIADGLFASIADDPHFYGQLAAEELGRLTTIPPLAAPPTPAEISRIEQNPSLQRAISLFELGWRSEAVREWNYGIRGMSDRELLAAAHFAHDHHIYDRAVNTSDRTVQEHDFNLRYLTPFKDAMMVKTAEIQLDPAWVYGLIRQESRFIMDAKSGVGASGLMQLMPATAKWVAKKIDMPDFSPSRVNELDVNLTLGTNYLNMVLNDLDGSPLLASAAYNAGPGRPMRWRASLPTAVEGAIFAETIPFDETRGYVKNVLSNATYYNALFTNTPQSLKERLGKVSPQSEHASNLP